MSFCNSVAEAGGQLQLATVVCEACSTLLSLLNACALAGFAYSCLTVNRNASGCADLAPVCCW